MELQDTFIHKGLRKQLVETIIAKGITNKEVIEAIGKIKRHLFVESYLQEAAYQDRALPIPAGQTISQPFTVAFQTELLQIKKGDKVLEVGTGSGYQTAVLLEVGAKVYTIERVKELYVKVRTLLEKMGYKANFFYGDGYEGKPTYGPFDKILITAGAPYIPENLLLQLKVGGILVAPIGEGDLQIMTEIVKVSENDFLKRTHGNFAFVPMLKGVVK